jgi:phosphonate transport system permease protein
VCWPCGYTTNGVLAKLFAEAVEAIDPRPVEGVRATGANALEEIVYGVIPQVLPLWISYSLYRFESNVRSASVVGMVGAGGIGVHPARSRFAASTTPRPLPCC